MPEADSFVFRTVQQAGGGSRQLPWGSADLSLTFDQRGIEISGERREEHSLLPWAAVTRVSRGATESTPDGGSVTVIGIESPGRIMRFAVASHRRDPIQLTALSEQVRRWSAATGSLPEGTEAAGTDPPEGAEAPEPSPPGTPPRATLSAPVVPVPPGRSPVSESTLPVLTGPPDGWYRPVPAPPKRPGRTRRVTILVVALVFLASGAGLAIVLSGSGGSRTNGPTTPPPTADQALADRLMLTRTDLPAGWTVSPAGGSGTGNSPRVRTGETKITRAFAHCMGISPSQAAVILGGVAPDQTAQTTSPVFVGPPAPDRPGFALELQTGASIVRSHQDEQIDFARLADPRYPQCAGAALASETQLGADSASGRNEKPSQFSVSAVDLAVPAGEQVSGLLVTFTVSDRSASVPVEVETVSLGHDRIEANLQALAIGGQIPTAAISAPLAVFEQRVAAGGLSAEA